MCYAISVSHVFVPVLTRGGVFYPLEPTLREVKKFYGVWLTRWAVGGKKLLNRAESFVILIDHPFCYSPS